MRRCASARIAEATRDRRRAGFPMSTLTGRAPRALAAGPPGAGLPEQAEADRPEARRSRAFQRFYSLKQHKPCPPAARAFALSITGAKSLRGTLKNQTFP